MDAFPPDAEAATICGSLIHFPPARCTRPDGHAGEHTTAEIPAPLSAVAARMVRESDRLEAERADHAAEAAARIRHLKVALVATIGAFLVVVGIGIALLQHHLPG